MAEHRTTIVSVITPNLADRNIDLFMFIPLVTCTSTSSDSIAKATPSSSAIRVPFPSPTPSTSPSTYIPSSISRLYDTSSSFASVSTLSAIPISASSSPSYVSVPALFFLPFCTAISLFLFPKAWVAPSMPASRHAHSWRLPNAFFAWSPSALMMILATARQCVSPIPTGHTPGLLPSVNIRHSISVQ